MLYNGYYVDLEKPIPKPLSELKTYIITILTIVLLLLVLHGVIYAYFVPIELAKLHGEMSKYRTNIDDFTVKFDTIYDIINKICNNPEFKDMCYNKTP